MNGQRIGYIRVSSIDQNTERQEMQLAGMELDACYTDKASGKDTNRPELIELLRYARQGDTIIVHSMDRLARNLSDLRKIVDDLTGRGIRVQFIKESLIFTGEDSPVSNLMLSVMGAVAEFERALIKERQMEGIAIAKAKGAFKGRKSSMSESMIAEMKKRIADGEKKAAVARDMKISRQTLYQYLNISKS
jgi:DNA invertase Pin-like site-specific DNA recombinase